MSEPWFEVALTALGNAETLLADAHAEGHSPGDQALIDAALGEIRTARAALRAAQNSQSRSE